MLNTVSQICSILGLIVSIIAVKKIYNIEIKIGGQTRSVVNKGVNLKGDSSSYIGGDSNGTGKK